ncbi:hypothetical protein GcM3_045040 [Golovinomyces cichoracearum]|uniref:Uncharacterized protein n=1 Tax=Golovinomyces cichoracearum TaxID=62708 RepID=A0A420J154_9PEZI|nr:hypothetical protein GcM3_045040 [Golovinomyces cichoracearum]
MLNALEKKLKRVMRGMVPLSSDKMLRQRIISMRNGVKELQETLRRAGDISENVAISIQERLLGFQRTGPSML